MTRTELLVPEVKSYPSLPCLVLLCCVALSPRALFGAPPFAEWLEGVRVEARERGIGQETIDLALSGLTPDARVIGFDRNQPEFVQTLDEYLTARVSPDRVREGRRLLRQHHSELRAIEARYGVAPKYLVAFWGLESSFGRYQGKYSVIRSVATLAHDERRSAFFREELFDALAIIDEGHVTPDRMVGGWAGAMGQNQFMPSSFLRYAQDFDGDGVKDIWGNTADVWASIANYLVENGWQHDQGWGMEVEFPREFNGTLLELKQQNPSPRCRALRYHTRELSMARWRALGVRRAGGGALPASELKSAIIIPESGEPKSYLTFPNFRTILSYNCANKYAISVGLMADLVES